MSSRAASAGTPARRKTAALVWHQVRYEQLSFWRDPQSAFFNFAFPLVFFAILAGVFGNATLATVGGRPVTGLQYYTSTIVAVSVMGACYSQLAITLSLRRQDGILKRLRGTPLPAWVMFAGLVAHCVMLSLIDAALIVRMGLLYGVPMPGHWPPSSLSLSSARPRSAHWESRSPASSATRRQRLRWCSSSSSRSCSSPAPTSRSPPASSMTWQVSSRSGRSTRHC